MREILFRAKREDNKEWVYGGLITYDLLHKKRCLIIKFDVKLANLKIEAEQMSEFVIPETVGQFTGLTDKNGIKIFEGDIVNCVERNSSNLFNTSNGKLVSHTTWENNIKETVEFTPASLQRLDYYHRCCGNLEVIGNIHEREKHENK